MPKKKSFMLQTSVINTNRKIYKKRILVKNRDYLKRKLNFYLKMMTVFHNNKSRRKKVIFLSPLHIYVGKKLMKS